MEAANRDFHRYFPISDRDKKWGLFVTTVGEARITPRMHYPPSGHPKNYDFESTRGRVINEFAIIYISSGQGWYECGRNCRQRIEPGSVIMVFPQVRHRYAPDLETGWCEHWIGFDGDIAHRWVKNNFLSPRKPILRSSAEDTLLTLFTGVVQAIKANLPALQQVMAGATCHVLGLLYSAQQAHLISNNRSHMIIEKVIARMQTSFGSEVDFQTLADELNVSYSWFRSTFVQHTGLSPHQYLLELRLVRARNMLTETDLPVKQVATQTGFEDEHYFSRFFSRRIGVTPMQWRARSRPQGERVGGESVRAESPPNCPPNKSFCPL